MVDFDTRCEFLPADIALITKWLGWLTPPVHLNNDASQLEREQWFWVSPEALDALEESLWDDAGGGEVPVLVPGDLPSLDGIMLLSNPMSVGAEADQARKAKRRRKRRRGGDGGVAAELKNLLALRWVARSDFLVVQPLYGTSLLAVLQEDEPDVQPADVIYAPPPEVAVRPGAWQHQQADGLWHAPRNCLDGSPLVMLLPDPRIWQWGRRPRVTTEDLADQVMDAMNAAIAAARAKLAPAVDKNPGGDLDLRGSLDAMSSHGDQVGTVMSNFASGLSQASEFGDAALDAFMADFGALASDKLPMMSPVPDIGSFTRPVAAECVDLPDENATRRLVKRAPLDCRREDASLARLLHCLWGFASRPLPPGTPRRIMRDIPKHRRGGSPADPAGVRVLVLREVSGHGTADAGSGRKRPRRHLVRGHWRQQWHPSLDAHRIRWIAPHLRAGNLTDAATEGPRTVRNVQASPAGRDTSEPVPVSQVHHLA